MKRNCLNIASFLLVLWLDQAAGQSDVRELLKANMETVNLQSQKTETSGVYACARAFEMLEAEYDFKSMVTKEYIGNIRGSTSSDLCRLIRNNHCLATPSHYLTKLDLMLFDGPVIANVRAYPDSELYNHWVCVYFDGESLWVSDGARESKKMSFADFLGVWNGNGILVSRTSDQNFLNVFSVRLWAFGCVILCLGFFYALVIRSNINPHLGLLLPVPVLAFISIYFFSDGSRILHGVRISCGSKKSIAHSIGLEELKNAIDDSSVLLIDSRPEEAFYKGSLPNAFNLPIGTGMTDYEDVFRGIDRSTPIFVFCYSTNCAFDDIVANRISLLGFTNVKASKEGYFEYRSSMESEK